MLTKNHVKQVKWNQFIKTEGNLGYVRNGNVLKSRVSEICVKQIRINQGVGVIGSHKRVESRPSDTQFLCPEKFNVDKKQCT